MKSKSVDIFSYSCIFFFDFIDTNKKINRHKVKLDAKSCNQCDISYWFPRIKFITMFNVLLKYSSITQINIKNVIFHSKNKNFPSSSSSLMSIDALQNTKENDHIQIKCILVVYGQPQSNNKWRIKRLSK